EAAFARLGAALAESQLAGLTSNLGFLARLVADPEMRAGRLDTGLIARQGDSLLADPEPDATDLALAAAALAGLLETPPETHWRPWGAGRSHVTLAGGETVALSVQPAAAGLAITAETPAGPTTLTLQHTGASRWQVATGAASETVHLHTDPDGVSLKRGTTRHRFTLADPLARGTEDGPGGDAVLAPLPGLIKSVAISAGDAVTQGATLAILEAMKMEHALTAPRDGVVAEVFAAPGDQVDDGSLLIRLEPEA
ncbi:MAG: biotin/lipoyl-containing protein, partial [Pseudomonadota bacterium]